MDKRGPVTPVRHFFIGLFSGLLVMAAAVSIYAGIANASRWGGKKEPNVKIREIYGILEAHSINDYDPDELLENMYRGLLDGVGDLYTYYFDEKAYASFTEQTEGVYAGVGMVVTTDANDRIVTVLVVYPKTPGERAGLLPGDKIVAVNGLDVTNSRLEEVTAMTKGKPGTKVNLTILRQSEDRTFDVDIVRENINILTVSHKMLDGAIGYIRIDGFERVTSGQFIEAYGALQQEQMQGLIIDLRDNPGGLLETVTQIADMLLPEGVIVYTEDKQGQKKHYYSDSNRSDLPLVIVVNEKKRQRVGGAMRRSQGFRRGYTGRYKDLR